MKNIKLTQVTKSAGIYCIMNLVDSKIYVGSSNSVYFRLRCHLSHLRLQKHGNKYLQRSFNKHGENSFYSYILQYTEEDKLLLLEDYYISLLKPEYNLIIVPSRHTPCEEIKLQISNTLKYKYKNGEIEVKYNEDLDISVKLFDIFGKHITTFKTIKNCAKYLGINYRTLLSRYRRGMYWVENNLLEFSNKEDISTSIVKFLSIEQNLKAAHCIDLNTGKRATSYKIRRILLKNPFEILLRNNCKYCYIGVNLIARVKLDKFRETPEVDNPEPTTNLNV